MCLTTAVALGIYVWRDKSAIAIGLEFHEVSHKPNRVPFSAKRRDRPGGLSNLASPAQSQAELEPVLNTAPRESDKPAPAPDPIFDDFGRWIEGYLAMPSGEARTALESEGQLLASMRRDALARLIESDPESAIRLAVSGSVRRQLPPAISRQLEEHVSARAKYEVIAVLGTPDEPQLSPVIERRVTIADRAYRAFVYGRRLQQTTKDQISLQGIAIGDALAVHESAVRALDPDESPDPLLPMGNVDGICPISKQASASKVAVEAGGETFHLCRAGHIDAFSRALEQQEMTIGPAVNGYAGAVAGFSWTKGPKRVLLMRVNFPDALAASISEADAYDMIRKANDFFVENSYGATSLSAIVTPLLTLPKLAAWYAANNATGALLDDARQIAGAAGFDPTNYDLDCVHFQIGRLPNQAYVGGKGVWLQTADPGMLCHELGHNFGLWHANAWVTSDGTATGAGRNQEYGNVFDTMGAGTDGPYHFNAYHKHRISWLPDTAVQTITRDGVYRLYPSDTGTLVEGLSYALKIEMDSGRDYWIETRRQLGAQPSSVLINWSPWSQSNGGSQLLDMTPGSGGGPYDAPLLMGRSFFDPTLGLKFTPWRLGGTTPESIDVVISHVRHFSIEAESGALTPPMEIASDDRASEGRFIWSPTADQGEASLVVDVPADDQYVIWCRIAEPTGGKASFALTVDAATPETCSVSGGLSSGGWQWGRLMEFAAEDANGASISPKLFALAAGTHVIHVQFAGVGTKLDALYLTSDSIAATPPSSPRLSARRQSNGHFSLELTGDVGSSYVIEATSDFAAWDRVGAVTNTIGTVQITDAVAAQHNFRFYRVVVK